MAPDEQLEWERRVGRPAGLAAFASGILLLTGQLIYPVAVISDRPNSQAESLQLVADNPAHAYVPGVLQALGYVAAIVPLYYLYRATKARRPELMSAARYFAILGPLITAGLFLTRQVMIADKAKEFDALNLPTSVPPGSAGAGEVAALVFAANDRAAGLIDEVNSAPVLYVGQFVGVLTLAFAFVLISLNAMRAGLLPRFLGYLGVIVGVLGVLAVLGPVGALVQIFFMLALGPLLMDRWPNGRGPAWESGEATPWPSAMDQRAAEAEAADADADADEDEPAVEPDDEPGEPADAPHPASKKRKKKKRR